MNTISNGELSDLLCDSENRCLTLIRLEEVPDHQQVGTYHFNFHLEILSTNVLRCSALECYCRSYAQTKFTTECYVPFGSVAIVPVVLEKKRICKHILSLLSYKYCCIQNNILNLELSFLVRSQILKSSSSSIIDFHKLKNWSQFTRFFHKNFKKRQTYRYMPNKTLSRPF